MFLQPIVEPDRNRAKETFKSMLKAKDPLFLKRTVDMIVTWDRHEYPPSIIYIHGDGDHTLPIRNIDVDHVIEGGSHMMTLTEGEMLSELIRSILLER